jgi:PIN domain nuclease of toxin-antitoxin system
MSLLLDAHVLVSGSMMTPVCPTARAAQFAQPAIAVLISAATGWEIATKTRRGRWPEADIRDFERLLATLDLNRSRRRSE